MNTNDDISVSTRINEICRDFESHWSPEARLYIDKFLMRIDEPNRQRLLTWLVDADLELRSNAGLKIHPSDYQSLGDFAVIKVQRFLKEKDHHWSTLYPSVEEDTQSESHPKDESGFSVNETFGKYRIVDRIGQGGMGWVYLAEDLQLTRKVALKIPKLKSDDELNERFIREAKSAAALQHPNICPIYDFGEIDGQKYLSMAYIDGPTLQARMDVNYSVDQFEAAQWIYEIAMALAEAHSIGVIHRDLKPANIIFNHRNEPVVLDFGLARWTAMDDVKLTQTGVFLGTPAYVSPEQIKKNESEEVGPLSDLYSLGVVFFQLLTGRLPFESPDAIVMIAKIVSESPPAPSSLNTILDPRIESACLKAIAKNPNDRHSSIKEFAIELSEILDSPRTDSPLNQSIRSDSPLNQSIRPHSGIFVLSLAILSFFMASCLVGVPIGMIVWSLANRNLDEMSREIRDPKGRFLTIAGKRIAQLAVGLGCVVFFISLFRSLI